MKRNKITTLIVVAFLMVISALLLYQFYTYQISSGMLKDISFVPLNNANELSTELRYIKLNQIEDTDRFINNVSIDSVPGFDYKIYSGIPSDINKKIVPRLLNEVKDTPEGEKYLMDRLNREYTNNTVIIERMGKPLERNTEYTVKLKYSDWNIFHAIFSPMKEYKFITGNSNKDQLEDIQTTLGFEVSSYVLFGTEEYASYKNDRQKYCPFWSSESIDKTSKYELISVECGFLKDEEKKGENVTVKVFTQDLEEGKKAFQEELERLGIEQGENLEVEYTHEPR